MNRWIPLQKWWLISVAMFGFILSSQAFSCDAPVIKKHPEFSCEQRWNYRNYFDLGIPILSLQETMAGIKLQIIGAASAANDIYAATETLKKALSGDVGGAGAEAIIDFAHEVLPGDELTKDLIAMWSKLVISCASNPTPTCIMDTIVDMGKNLVKIVAAGGAIKSFNANTIAHAYLLEYYQNGGSITKTIDQVAASKGIENAWWGTEYSVGEVQTLINGVRKAVSDRTKLCLADPYHCGTPIVADNCKDGPRIQQYPHVGIRQVTKFLQTGVCFTPGGSATFYSKQVETNTTETFAVSGGVQSDGTFRMEYTPSAVAVIGEREWYVRDDSTGKISNTEKFKIRRNDSSSDSSIALFGYPGVTADSIDDPAPDCLPDLAASQTWLTDAAGNRITVVNMGEGIIAHTEVTNIGCSDIPSSTNGITVMFLASKGEKEDPHNSDGDSLIEGNGWEKIGTANIKSYHLKVGMTKGERTPESGVFVVDETFFPEPGKYNIVACADRTRVENNEGGEVVEIHESNNCTTEAVFTVFARNYPPVGNIESASCSGVTGWASDSNTPAPIAVHFYADGPAGTGAFVGSITAENYRTDMGMHGFHFSIPAVLLDNQTHSLYAYALDSEGGTNPLIGNISLPDCAKVQAAVMTIINLLLLGDDDYTLTLNKTGAGSGTVTSSPEGIDCGTDCSEPYADGTTIDLTATPMAGSIFAGWGGVCLGTGGCEITMDSHKTVTANFALGYTLVVTKSGIGSGTVTSSPMGINCGSDCSEPYAPNASVILTATPAAGSTFAGWGGACSGMGACNLTMDTNKGVTANFTRPLLTVTLTGAGTGTVTSNPGGISCGADCSENYNQGTIVGLAALASAGSTFAGWSGACLGTGTCNLTMDAAKTVTATFNPITYVLIVTRSGSGTGTVSSSPVGISCGADCSENFTQGTAVGLTALASVGSTFAGWSGACSGTGACNLTMDAAKTVSAIFNPITYTMTVTRSGSGTGTVSSTPVGISCGADCSENFTQGTAVGLTALASAGSTFAGWSGACSGTGACNLTMDATKTVTATFNPIPLLADAVDNASLIWTTGGNAAWTRQTTTTHDGSDAAKSGTIGNSQQSWLETSVTGPGTLSFWWMVSSQANADYLRFSIDGTQQTQISGTVSWQQKTYSIAAGAHVLRWTYIKNYSTSSGSDAGWIDQVQFSGGSTPTYALSVTKAGTGSGTVTSNPAGISCGTDCTENYAQGASVTLTAAAASGSTFAGWSGGGCSGTGNCVATMNSAQTVTATFNTSGGISPLADAVDKASLTWTTGGNAAWTRQTTTTHDGSDAAKSGTIGNSQQSWLETSVTGPGTLSFWWMVSSQANADYLRFSIDGTQQTQISGTVSWQQKTYTIAAGTHTLRWTYIKNYSTSSGSDAGWVDQVQFP